jgi:hypothetical protein
VNSVIVRPADQDRMSLSPRPVTGWALSASPVRRVEVSTDGGASWREAALISLAPTLAWQRFGFEWQPAAPGVYEIRARATDSQGRVQPDSGRNAVHAIAVSVS